MPVSDFENLYRAVPLGQDGVISLLRRDGVVLAQHPRDADTANRLPSAPVMTLIAEGFGAHVPKGYIYTAMAFSAAVEGLNMLARRRRKAARLG